MFAVRLAVVLAVSSCWLCAQQGSDAADKTPSDFVRFVKVADGGHLDTAITTYKKGDVTLTLFGAVHIADAKCYAALNDRFTQCEVLLYELVGPPDYRPTKNREERGFNPVSLLQQGLKNSLELTEPSDVLLLEDQQRLDLAGIPLVVKHAPGHTEGSVVFELDEVMFSGDVLFAGSIGRTDLPGGDHAAMIESLRRVILPASDHLVVLPGHGPQTTIAAERAANPYLRQLVDDVEVGRNPTGM